MGYPVCVFERRVGASKTLGSLCVFWRCCSLLVGRWTLNIPIQYVECPADILERPDDLIAEVKITAFRFHL